jgi:hypothetical protein
MSGNREDEKTRIKALFNSLNECSLSYGDENTVTSIEEFYEAQGYITAKQKELLISIRERSE